MVRCIDTKVCKKLACGAQ